MYITLFLLAYELLQEDASLTGNLCGHYVYGDWNYGECDLAEDGLLAICGSQSQCRQSGRVFNVVWFARSKWFGLCLYSIMLLPNSGIVQRLVQSFSHRRCCSQRRRCWPSGCIHWCLCSLCFLDEKYFSLHWIIDEESESSSHYWGKRVDFHCPKRKFSQASAQAFQSALSWAPSSGRPHWWKFHIWGCDLEILHSNTVACVLRYIQCWPLCYFCGERRALWFAVFLRCWRCWLLQMWIERCQGLFSGQLLLRCVCTARIRLVIFFCFLCFSNICDCETGLGFPVRLRLRPQVLYSFAFFLTRFVIFHVHLIVPFSLRVGSSRRHYYGRWNVWALCVRWLELRRVWSCWRWSSPNLW